MRELPLKSLWRQPMGPKKYCPKNHAHKGNGADAEKHSTALSE